MIPDSVFEKYLSFVRQTEPPVMFHRWSFLGCMGAMLGRNVWLPFGTFRIFPNQFIMLIGDPGSRKSTAIKLAAQILTKSGYSSFAANKTSKEKFLLDLEGVEEDGSPTVQSNHSIMESLLGSGVGDPKEVFICADEFNDFMRTGDLEFHSMLGGLWDWDNESVPYTYRLKNSRSVSIFQPTISLLGGNTHTNFAEMFPPQAIGQGFISRLLLIYSEPSGRRNAFPEPPNEAQELSLIRDLQQIKATIRGPVSLHPKAKEILTYLYNTYEGIDDIRFVSYNTRRYTHLLKLCIIIAACRCSTTIESPDVIEANSILAFAEVHMPAALGEFGRAKNSAVQQRILEYLRSENSPIELNDIWKQVSTDIERSDDLQRILQGLAQAGKIKYIKKLGSNPSGFIAIRPTVKTSQLYQAVERLPEYQDAISRTR